MGGFLIIRMFVSGFVLVVLICSLIAMNGPLRHFVDMSSILLVSGGVFCGTLWSFPVSQIAEAFQDSFGIGGENEPAEGVDEEAESDYS